MTDDVLGLLPPLRRYALSLTRDPGAADDLVQDTLVRAYEKRGLFRSSRGLKGWLLSILHNAFVDGRRQRMAEIRREDEMASSLETVSGPEQEAHVRLAQVREAFLNLPEEQRAALHLVAIEGLSYIDAAEALAIPVGTLMSRLARGRAALRAFEDAAPDLEQPLVGRPSLRVISGGGTDD